MIRAGAARGGPVALAGERSAVELLVEHEHCPKTVPMIVGTARGGFHYPTFQVSADLQPVFEWINAREDGAWVGYQEWSPSAKRPVGFIQSNLSRYYTNHYRAGWAGSPKIWKDFYFAAYFALVGQIDAAFAAEDVLIHHPTLNSNQWSGNMQGTLLDALGHLADSRSLAVERVHLGCPHGMTVNSLCWMAGKLNHEQASSHPPALRPNAPERLKPSEVGCPDLPGLSLASVPIPRLWKP